MELKYKADTLIPEGRHLRFGESKNVLPTVEYFSGGGAVKVPMIWRRVDFLTPDCPTMETISPRRSSKFVPRSTSRERAALVLVAGISYTFVMSRQDSSVLV